MICGDKSHPSHIGRKRVNLADSARDPQTVLPAAQVKGEELVRVGNLEFGSFHVGASDPIPTLLQIGNQVMTNESTRSRYQHSFPF